MPNDPPKKITQHANGKPHTYTYHKSEDFTVRGKKWKRHIYLRDDHSPLVEYGDTRLMTFTITDEEVPEEKRPKRKPFKRSQHLRDYIRKYGERK